MSKRSRKRKKRSTSQIIFVAMSALLAFSMIVSLIVVALPGPPVPTPTPWPTWTPIPTRTPLPPPSATPAPTEAPIGPELPTATITPTLTVTPSALVPTVEPAAAVGPAAAEDKADTWTFAVCGDSRDNERVYQRVLDAVAASDTEFLINTGDLVNKGTETQWKDFREIMAGFPLPFYPVPGNHDGLDGSLDGYPASNGAPATHYSFERGPILFVMADSHHGGITAAELAWLREALGASELPVKMVFLHHPPFDPDGTDHIMAFGNEPFMDLMVAQAVDYVFAGHIHAYAREARDGVLYTITGGAGAPLYKKDHPQSFHHYLRVTVRGEEVKIEVVEI